MKEREQNELTNQSNSSNLEAGGDIFMPDGPNSGPEQPHGQEESKHEQESSRDASSQHNPPSGGGQQDPLSEEEKAIIKSKTEREIRQELHMQRVHEFAQKVRDGEIDERRAAEMFIDQFGDDEKRRLEDVEVKREDV
ncbi:hypothetical protein M1307_01715 [Patescibacteria group bacterium]|nr:hypothetical protein [Patescibacteria group bacterium]